MRGASFMAAGAAARAFALLVDGALLIRRQQLWRTETTHLETAIWFPREAAIPSGCLDNGLAYGPALTDARCFALLYTASTCSFCSAQLPEWRSLVRISRTLGCDALRVVPRRSGGRLVQGWPTRRGRNPIGRKSAFGGRRS